MSKNITMLPFAMVDILGFTELIETNNIQTVIKHYLEFSSTVFSSASFKDLPPPDFHFISDSIFVFADIKEKQLIKSYTHGMLRYLSNLIHNSVFSLEYESNKNDYHFSIPLRASFSYGEYVAIKEHKLYSNSDKSVPIILGRALITAYKWERKQKWLGASIDPDSNKLLSKHFPDLIEKLRDKNLLVEYEVPFEKEYKGTHAINFNVKGHSKKLLSNLYKCKKKYRNNGLIANKYEETIKFLEYCVNNRLEVPVRWRDNST